MSEINHPAATNFSRALNKIGEPRLGTLPIFAPFCYINLEPEVLAYMRTLCVRTNICERAADGVMFDMLETLDTMPSELKPAATNRWQRTHAQMEADRLSALPVGQLNDLPWIAEEE